LKGLSILKLQFDTGVYYGADKRHSSCGGVVIFGYRTPFLSGLFTAGEVDGFLCFLRQLTRENPENLVSLKAVVEIPSKPVASACELLWRTVWPARSLNVATGSLIFFALEHQTGKA
jgi:hypothetical protein